MTYSHVYKLLTAPDGRAADDKGVTATALDEGDGYVHLSTAGQVAETARLHYAGKPDTRLLAFRVADLPPLTWEESRGGQLFPHLYAPLDMTLVHKEWVLALAENGAPQVPEGLAE